MDRRRATHHVADIVLDDTARDLWIGNDIASSAIESYPQDAMRGGYTISVANDDDSGQAIRDAIADIDGNLTITRALEYERAYGGAAIYPVVNDGVPDLSLPLDLERCQKIENLLVLEPRELLPVYWSDGAVEVWRLQKLVQGGVPPPVIDIHASRLILLPGIKVSSRPTMGHLYGHGHSVLTRMNEVLKDFGITWASAGTLLHSFAQGVLSIDGLADMLGTAGGEQKFLDRVAAMDMAMSTLRSLVIDARDKYQREATPLAGLADLLDRFAQRLAAAVRMPVTKLMGMSPAGMNATGDGDSRNWYDAVAAFQKDKCQSPVERLIEILVNCKDGPTNGTEPDQWSVEWLPLWEPTQEEQVKARLTQAQIDQIYLTTSVLSPEEVAKARFGGGAYSFETPVDFDARESLDVAAPPPVDANGDPNAELAQMLDPTTGTPVPPGTPGAVPAPPGHPLVAPAPSGKSKGAMLPPGGSAHGSESTPSGETEGEQWTGVGKTRAGDEPRPARATKAPTKDGPKKPTKPIRRADALATMTAAELAALERALAHVRAVRLDFVEQRGSKWVVLDESRTKVLGEHDTEADANAQLGAIEAAKHAREDD